MADTACTFTNGDTPASNPGMRVGASTRRQHQPFKGQNFQLWMLTVTTDNLKAAHYNKIKQQTIAITAPLCDGNITHVLQAIKKGKDTVFIKPTLNSTTPTEGEKMEFKIDRTEYLADKRTYDNNKTRLAQSFIGQCALPVVGQLRGI